MPADGDVVTTDYLIPAAPLERSEEIKKSRFITFLAHTETVEAAKAWIAQVRSAHPDARHHCWGFIAGAPDASQLYGFSDDGEPSGTAGKPILAQLQGSGFGEISAIVVRYYGGIQLGTGGLVKAYGGGVGMALKELSTVLKIHRSPFRITCHYSDIAVVESLINRYDGELLSADYSQEVTLQVNWPSKRVAYITHELTNRTHGRVLMQPLTMLPDKGK